MAAGVRRQADSPVAGDDIQPPKKAREIPFKKFYSVNIADLSESDRKNLIETIQQNLKILAKVGIDKHKLCFDENGKITSEPAWSLSRKFRGPLRLCGILRHYL